MIQVARGKQKVKFPRRMYMSPGRRPRKGILCPQRSITPMRVIIIPIISNALPNRLN